VAVVAVANQKGGVGKTTTVVNLAAALREFGFRVLVVDNDPQASLALALGIANAEDLMPTLGDLLMDAAGGHPRLSAGDAIRPTDAGVDLLPCNSRLAAAEMVLVGCMGREFVLRDVLAGVGDAYDFVILDCLPGLGLLSVNGLTSADSVLIPVQADYLALHGLTQVLHTIGAVRAKLNPALATLGVLLTMVDPRTVHAREVMTILREGLEDLRIFRAQVYTQVALKESVRRAESVLTYRSDSQAAWAYRDLAEELIGVCGIPAPHAPIRPEFHPPTRRAAGEPAIIAGLRVRRPAAAGDHIDRELAESRGA
jgi:chromosome partitioning protein